MYYYQIQKRVITTAEDGRLSYSRWYNITRIATKDDARTILKSFRKYPDSIKDGYISYRAIIQDSNETDPGVELTVLGSVVYIV